MTQSASAASIDNRYRRPTERITARRYALPTHDVEIHVQGCECEHCAPPAPIVDDRLGLTALGNLALAAVLVGSAIAFAIDAHGAWAALRSVVGL